MKTSSSFNQCANSQNHEFVKSVIYIIGDNYSSKQQLMRFLLGDNYDYQLKHNVQNNSLNIYYSSVLGSNKLIQIYQFSSDRFLRQYLDVYFKILPKPNIILYCTDIQSSQKQIQQWIQLIQNQSLSIVFISDINTIPQRTQLISKISCFFQKDVVDYIYLPNINTQALYSCVSNINNGMSLKNYIRKVNTWSSMKMFFKTLSNYIKRKPQITSVV